VAAGVRQLGGGSDFAIARYLGDQADLSVTKSDAGFDP
jgi:hypothetical protein